MPATDMEMANVLKYLAADEPRGATYDEMCLTAQSGLQMVAHTQAKSDDEWRSSTSTECG